MRREREQSLWSSSTTWTPRESYGDDAAATAWAEPTAGSQLERILRLGVRVVAARISRSVNPDASAARFMPEVPTRRAKTVTSRVVPSKRGSPTADGYNA
jgi:hypothetical protein